MKLFLLFLCLFGVVVAEPWQVKWMKNSIEYLNTEIEFLTSGREDFHEMGLFYLRDLYNNSATKMENLRIEMKNFLKNPRWPQDSPFIDSEPELVEFDRLRSNFSHIKEEAIAIGKPMERETTKFVFLLIAADQSIVNNHELPDPILLINEVKSIVSKESRIGKHPNSSEDIVAEVDDWYRRNSFSYWGFMSDLKSRTTVAQAKANSMIEQLKQVNTVEAKEEIHKLTKAMNLASATSIDMYKRIPIDSLNKADEMLVFAGENLRRFSEFETLVNTPNNIIN